MYVCIFVRHGLRSTSFVLGDVTKSWVSHFSFILLTYLFFPLSLYTYHKHISPPSTLLGYVASKSGVHGSGTKKAPLSVQSPWKHLDLGSSGEFQGNL